MEKILIPVIANCDIEESVPATGIGCKKGDIFYFNPDHEIHVALKDSGCFTSIDNKKCIFICDYPVLNLGEETYRNGEQIDISQLTNEVIDNLVLIGYIKKVYKEKKPSNKNNSITYIKFAKKKGLTTAELKDILSQLNIVADMRKNMPVNQQRKVSKLLK